MAAGLALLLLSGCAGGLGPDLRALLGLGATGDSHHAAAVDRIETPRSLPPAAGGLAGVLSRVAATAAAAGDHTAALRLYQRAHGLAPQDIAIALGLARAARAAGDHRTSVTAYQRLLTVDSKHFSARQELGRVLLALGAVEDAIPHLRAALEHRPDAALHNELGIAHDLIGDHATAQRHFRAGIGLVPGDLVLRTNLGRSLALSGRAGEAIATLRAVTLSPLAEPVHWEALALAYASAGDTNSALRAAGRGRSRAVDRKRFENIGEMIQNRDRPALAGLIASSALRDRFADTAVTANGRADATPRSTGGTAAIAAAAPPFDRSIGSSAAEIATQSAGAPTELPQITPAAGNPDVPKPIYRVQIAAYYSRERAEQGWRQIRRAAPDLLQDIRHTVIRPPADALFRLRTQAFAGRRPAHALCRALSERTVPCIVVKTSS